MNYRELVPHTPKFSQEQLNVELKKISPALVSKKPSPPPSNRQPNTELPWANFTPKTVIPNGAKFGPEFDQKYKTALNEISTQILNPSRKNTSKTVLPQRPTVQSLKASNRKNGHIKVGNVTYNSKGMELKEGEIVKALIYLLQIEGIQDSALYFYGQDLNNLVMQFVGNIQGFINELCESKFNNVKTIFVNVENFEDDLRKRPVLEFIKTLMPSYNGQQVFLIKRDTKSGNHILLLPALNESNSSLNSQQNAGKGKKSTKKTISKSTKSPKIHTGPNGGKYYIKNGKKVYVK
jgi:hypothetical protein